MIYKHKLITLMTIFSFMSVGWGQDCDEGYTEILDIPESVTVTDSSNCFFQSDLDVLQQFIDNSQEGDYPPPSDLSPIELGTQVWEDGRLIYYVVLITRVGVVIENINSVEKYQLE